MDEILQLITNLTTHPDAVVRQAATESAGKVVISLLNTIAARRTDLDTVTAEAAETALDDAWSKLRSISQDWRNG